MLLAASRCLRFASWLRKFRFDSKLGLDGAIFRFESKLGLDEGDEVPFGGMGPREGVRAYSELAVPSYADCALKDWPEERGRGGRPGDSGGGGGGLPGDALGRAEDGVGRLGVGWLDAPRRAAPPRT